MQLLAHRGHQGLAPENSISGLLSLPPGIDGIEVDVRASADGVPVLLHDADLARKTDGSGVVEETAFAMLRKLRVKGSAEPPPRLEVYLDRAANHLEFARKQECHASGSGIYLDIKIQDKAVLERVAREVSRLSIASRIVWLARNRSDFEILAGEARVGSRFGLLGCNRSNFAESLAVAGHYGLEIMFLQHGRDAFLENMGLVGNIRSAGLQAGASILNGLQDLELAREAGCTHAITDFPPPALLDQGAFGISDFDR